MNIMRTIAILAGIILMIFGAFRLTRVLSAAVPAQHSRYHLGAAIGALLAGGSRIVPDVLDARFFMLIGGVALFLWGSTRLREVESKKDAN